MKIAFSSFCVFITLILPVITLILLVPCFTVQLQVGGAVHVIQLSIIYVEFACFIVHSTVTGGRAVYISQLSTIYYFIILLVPCFTVQLQMGGVVYVTQLSVIFF